MFFIETEIQLHVSSYFRAHHFDYDHYLQMDIVLKKRNISIEIYEYRSNINSPHLEEARPRLCKHQLTKEAGSFPF